jgi:NAD(P)H-nitrite reductase large subunit
MKKPIHYVSIGAGISGLTAAHTIRMHDRAGRVTIISSEHDLPYRRYALPKFICGSTREAKLPLHEPRYYTGKRIELRLGQKVHRIDFENRKIFLRHKEIIRYDMLLIASGSQAHIPAYLAHLRELVHTLRTLDDARALRNEISNAKDAFIIGGSLASLGLLEALTRAGVRITFLLNRESFWPLSLSDTDYDEIVKRLSKKPNLILLTEDDLESVRRDGDWLVISTKRGTRVTSSLIMGSYGYTPEVSFLNPREIAIDRGILVDDHLRTSVDDVWASGDCAQPYHRGMKNYYVNFGWPNAKSQGRIAGLNMSGRPTMYDTLKVNPFDIEGIEVGTPWWKRF